MSFVNVWIHFVWTTKEKRNTLKKELRYRLFMHMKTYAANSGVHLDYINGVEDHVHCLISMKSTQSTAKVMHLIKGESSRWVNSSFPASELFEWQHEYYAASVNPEELNEVRSYIKYQYNHHLKEDFSIEKEVLFGLKSRTRK